MEECKPLLVGRIIGKAVFDGHLVDAHFTRPFYKHMLGRVLHSSTFQLNLSRSGHTSPCPPV
jgi:hypothetical protein